MTKKAELILKILKELRLAQHQSWVPPPQGHVGQLRLPPVLPVGDGNQLAATDELLQAVSEYARIVADNEPRLKSTLRFEELETVLRQAFGQTLATTDLDCDDGTLMDEVADRVSHFLKFAAERRSRDLHLVLGCWLIEDDSLYPIDIGPVKFEIREHWLQRVRGEGLVSQITARRLLRAWAGETLRERKAYTMDAYAEQQILKAIGPCPVVCSVTTNGLSSKLTCEKGVLAARLGVTGLSLMWGRPSQALKWMNLLYDGRLFNHDYAVHDGRQLGGGSSISQMPGGYRANPSLVGSFTNYRWIFDEIGRSLSAYVRPNETVDRPSIFNALFLSMWWYQQACREPSDQIATTKHAASMDALTGGRKANGILSFLEARYGCKPDQPLMSDGRTARAVVTQLYNNGRSCLIHGSSKDYMQDWAQIRTTAEIIGRLFISLAADWIANNPSSDDIAELQRPERSKL